MFESVVDEITYYGTHGGTAFLVNLEGNTFAVTCNHVLKDFSWQDICITNTKFGEKIVGLKSVFRPSNPSGAAVDSDILDVAILQFADDSRLSDLKDTAYILDKNTVETSRIGDELHVCGALKDLSTIGESKIKPKFGLLDFNDTGLYEKDIVLRDGTAQYTNVEFENLVGISGSPVFNKTLGKLCGMAVRAGLKEGKASLKYIDIEDITNILHGICNGSLAANYTKEIIHPK